MGIVFRVSHNYHNGNTCPCQFMPGIAAGIAAEIVAKIPTPGLPFRKSVHFIVFHDMIDMINRIKRITRITRIHI